LDHFLTWYRPPRTARTPSSIYVRLCALRKLAAEAADNGQISPELAASIGRVRRVGRRGVRLVQREK
jgi:hypothetical protein